MTTSVTDTWHPTACILCSLNCGIEVRVADGHLAKVRGDKVHPMSQGYTCQKALCLVTRVWILPAAANNHAETTQAVRVGRGALRVHGH
jgi:hypothetical protein